MSPLGRRRPGDDFADEPSVPPDVQLLAGALLAHLDAVVVFDADGTEVVRNGPAERFHDGRHGDALASAAIDDLIAQALRGLPGERELSLFGPPREVLRMWAQPIVQHGMVIGAVAFVRDVTEARRVESIRRDFVANVSHELKTPIGALTLLAETMAAGGDEALLQQLAQRLAREADRLGRIVDDLLDLSLIEAQESPERVPVPVAALVEEAIERVRPAASAVVIPLRVAAIPPDLAVECDRTQVVSALTNLLDNAVKYSEAGSPVVLDVYRGDGFVTITVSDEGIGIPSRELERIFERFYRVDRARSRATGGTGLGLAIVRHVAQAHGGDVQVESREGEGSVFRLRLPLVVAPNGSPRVLPGGAA
jgi:two-component system sensor histidine kinase SenX3